MKRSASPWFSVCRAANKLGTTSPVLRAWLASPDGKFVRWSKDRKQVCYPDCKRLQEIKLGVAAPPRAAAPAAAVDAPPEDAEGGLVLTAKDRLSNEKRQAEIDLLRAKIAKESGSHIPMESVRLAWAEQVRRLRLSLNAIPQRAADALVQACWPVEADVLRSLHEAGLTDPNLPAAIRKALARPATLKERVRGTIRRAVDAVLLELAESIHDDRSSPSHDPAHSPDAARAVAADVGRDPAHPQPERAAAS